MEEVYIQITGKESRKNGLITKKYATFGPFDDVNEALDVADREIEFANWNDEEEEGDRRFYTDFCTWHIDSIEKDGTVCDYPPEFLETRDMAKWVKKNLCPDKF